MNTDTGFQSALLEAKAGYNEGGVPIGSAIVDRNGKIIGRGRNRRVQEDDMCLHAEISALRTLGAPPASIFKSSTLYTTLSPCEMCTGAILLFKIPRVVIGENQNFVAGSGAGENLLREKGVEVIVLDNEECVGLMGRFRKEKPGIWRGDIGVDEEENQ
ncbi:MAG: cytosine deaminase [Alyxoria varia]|nr:MAG: cytosine deaminase [Alyxoria varia]